MFAHHRLRLLVIALLFGLTAALPGLVAATPVGYTTTTVIPYLSGGYTYQVVPSGTGAGFEAPAFNDSAWNSGAAAFGTVSTFCPLNAATSELQTPWPTSTDLLLRKSFTLPAAAKNLTVGVAIDNDVQVFLNGTDISGGLQTHEGCATRDSFVFSAPDSLLIAGANVLAVRGRDRGGIDYLDVQVKADEDTTAPSLAPTVTPNPVVLNGAATATANATDSESGIASQSCAPVDTSSVGAHTVACTATDNAGNTNQGSANYTVVYAPLGGTCLGAPGHTVLQPVNADGTSVFKLGSTVPVKFRVCDANGASIGTAGVVTSFVLTSTSVAPSSTVNEDVVSTAADTAFRWDATAQQWIFNLSTKNLRSGVTYTYTITLNDGSSIVFAFTTK